MPHLDIDALVFDVLGTLVDEPTGLRTAVRELDPTLDEPRAGRLVAMWQQHIAREQQRMAEGERAYADTDVVDREAAEQVAEAVGIKDEAALARLAEAAHRLPAWPDSAAGLARLARGFPVLGLSNASRTALLRLNASAGLRWHQALSAEDVRAYKPDPEVYRLAVTASGRPPERLLMIAAHAWDLRGAQKLGMRTAYVARPVGDPPGSADRFDLYAEDLTDLARQLGVES
ncbi:haloacid dehalogenase type II [Streptomyces sp. TRM66268-LWL]|uniref:Haloacid dehalogenase type II n=1 Tax=Streptomyces polyasparticus TaxID=2767826 RepID=A0ABR7SL14_9ACTN|nr:haloacid dehalogenase type II [Streptomyces polyasparticus]MBC9716165.1 haloacid dehalogenase type II [Streptomyces polyasparticus]